MTNPKIKIKICKSKDNQYYFSIKSNNDETIIVSEMYMNLSSAEFAIDYLVNNMATAEVVYDIL